MTISYENIISSYNLGKTDALLGTTKVPNLTDYGTDGSGNTYITYTFFQSGLEIGNSYYVDGGDEETHFASTYNQAIESAAFGILNDGSYWSASFDNVLKVNFIKPENLSNPLHQNDIGIIAFGQLQGTHPVWTDASQTAGSAPYDIAYGSLADEVYGDIFFNVDHQGSTQGLEPNDNIWTDFGAIEEGTAAYKAIYEEISHSLGIDFLNINGGNVVGEEFATQKYSVTSYIPYGHIAGSDAFPDVDTDLSSVILWGEDNDGDGNQDILHAYGLQLYDIAALQALYDADDTTRIADDTYKLGQGLGRDGTGDGIINASDKNKAFIYTIWDGDGNDTIDASGFDTFGAKIDLRPGYFSSIGTDGKGGALYDPNSGIDGENVAIAYDTDIENAIGTIRADKLIGNALDNVLDGGRGNDILEGGAGNDTLIGYRDRDTLRGEQGDDTLNGGSSEDTYYFELNGGVDTLIDDWYANNIVVFEDNIDFADVSVSVQGDDFIYSHIDGSQFILEDFLAQTYDSTLEVNFNGNNNSADNSIAQIVDIGLDTLNDILGFHPSDGAQPALDNSLFALGKDGNDHILGGANNDYIDGGEGNDTISTGGGNDVVYGGEGDDHIILSQSSYYNGTAIPNDNDIKYLYGDAGDDWFSVESSFAGTVYTSDSSGDDLYTLTASIDASAEIIDLQGNDYYDITSPIFDITDNNGDDYYKIRYNDNVGTITIDDTHGNDTLQLNDGNNYLGYTQNGSDIHLQLYYNSVQTIKTLVIENYFSSSSNLIENVILGDTEAVDFEYFLNPNSYILGTNSYDLNLFGTSADDRIYGFAGPDVLEGNGGNDRLVGGTGNDTLKGGIGDDEYIFNVGDGQDTITEEDGSNDFIRLGTGILQSDLILTQVGNNLEITFVNNSTDKITINDQYDNTTTKQVEKIIFSDSSELSLVGTPPIYGTSASETLNGTNDGESIFGYEGDDTIYAGLGDDTLIGGAGNDTLDGGSGIDVVDYSASTSGVTVNIQSGTADDGMGGTDTLVSIENIIGSEYADVLVGNNLLENEVWGLGGNDNLQGRGAVDTLHGGDGTDDLRGGDGDDILYGGADTDYLYGNADDDYLDGGAGVDAIWGHAGADTFGFTAGDAFTGSDNIKDFSLTDGDMLDISDLLQGYDPLNDLITDFVEITDNGTHSYLKVDVDGGADNFVQIAQISAITGLTDEDALETGGTLITV